MVQHGQRFEHGPGARLQSRIFVWSQEEGFPWRAIRSRYIKADQPGPVAELTTIRKTVV